MGHFKLICLTFKSFHSQTDISFSFRVRASVHLWAPAVSVCTPAEQQQKIHWPYRAGQSTGPGHRTAAGKSLQQTRQIIVTFIDNHRWKMIVYFSRFFPHKNCVPNFLSYVSYFRTVYYITLTPKTYHSSEVTRAQRDVLKLDQLSNIWFSGDQLQ